MTKIKKILKIRWIIKKIVEITKLDKNTIYKIKNWKNTNFESKIRVFNALKDLEIIDKDLLYNEKYF